MTKADFIKTIDIFLEADNLLEGELIGFHIIKRLMKVKEDLKIIKAELLFEDDED